jgi:hypothetical protein
LAVESKGDAQITFGTVQLQTRGQKYHHRRSKNLPLELIERQRFDSDNTWSSMAPLVALAENRPDTISDLSSEKRRATGLLALKNARPALPPVWIEHKNRSCYPFDSNL